MTQDIRSQITQLLQKAVSDLNIPGELPGISVDIPLEKIHGEFTCNIAMQLSRILRKAPLEIAESIVRSVQANLKDIPFYSKIKKIEVKKPGFINFYLTNEAFYDIVSQIFRENNNYGNSGFGHAQPLTAPSDWRLQIQPTFFCQAYLGRMRLEQHQC